MARQDINIGVEGNDGTGDSIRESFRKVNENFQEVYAVFGQGGAISFTALGDTPDELTPNTIPLVNDAGTELQLVTLASNSALDEDAADTITFSYSVPGKLVISTAFTKLSDDLKPQLGGPLNVGNNAIANVAISATAVSNYNSAHSSSITIDDLVITKGYADRRYISSGLPIRVAAEPRNTDQYILEINRYISGNIEVLSHGYDSTINGTAFVFNSIYNDPLNLKTEVAAGSFVVGATYIIQDLGSTNFVSIGADENTVGTRFVATGVGAGTGVAQPVYFLRYISTDQLAVFLDYDDATQEDDTAVDIDKIQLSGTIDPDDTHTMTDAAYDSTLEGNFLSDVAMPRKSVVRRQGDTMTGVLTLSDHPGDVSGFGVVNGSDDLQAATKFYVDNSGYSSTVNIFVSMDGDDLMTGVPPGKEGSALNYAYRTINAAAKRAEEIITTSPAEPGPYFQTVTKDNGDSTANVTIAQINTPVYTQAHDLIKINREYIQKEITAYIAFTYPDFVYNIDLCERDTGLILDAIRFDIKRGLTANYLTRQAAERYYSNTSARYAIGSQQINETVDAITVTRDIVDAVLQNKLYREKSIDSVARTGVSQERARVTTTTNHGLIDGEQVIFKDMGGMTEIEGQSAYVKVIDADTFELYTDPFLLQLWDISAYTNYTTGGKMGVVYQPRNEDFETIKITQTFDSPNAGSTERAAIGNRFDLILNIIQNGIEVGGDVVYGSTYKLVLDNGSRTYVDQGDPTNIDTLPGKIMVGVVSGAQGRIVSLTSNDGTVSNNDTFQLVQLNGKDFEVGEPVKYGNFVKTKQVTIFVESGTYEEDLPIRLANNVSLKGDEFRRVIIRPKDRVSQSPWSSIYFYRDAEFDGLTLTTAGAPFYNQNGEFQGYFGRHYLTDPERNVSVLPDTVSLPFNSGNYPVAAEVLQQNKSFIASEVLYYINNNYQDLLYSKVKCERDIGLILDAVGYDIALGTNYNAITAGLAYQRANNAYNLNFEKTNTIAALTGSSVTVGSPGTTYYSAKDLVAALPDITGTAETRSNSAFNEIVDIIDNNTPDALSFPAPSILPSGYGNADDAATRLQNNRDFIRSEIIAWIGDNYPFLDYNTTKCSRDVGYIVDALTYDILYGGDSATVTSATSYFVGTASQLGVGETAATVASYGRLGVIVDQIVRGVTVTKSSTNLDTQNTTGANATSAEGNRLIALVTIISDAIDNGTVAGLTATTPNLSSLGVSATLQSAQTAINSSRSTIIDSTIDYLDNTVTFVYDQDKCARDVGLIIDAISTDLVRGGQEYTLEAQGDYYSNYINQFDDAEFGDDKTITSSAISYISTLASSLLISVAPTQNTSVAPDISVGSGESGTVSIVGNLIDIITYAFNPSYNPPKRNSDDGVDVFMMSDATIVRNVTVQGHGGFMVVLDPEGQILTKSPYIQTGSSFSRSRNRKAFTGGMFVDAFVGNIPTQITAVNSAFELELESEQGQGLFIRAPELPCPFYLDGVRYQVNAISNYDSAAGTVTIYLDSGSNSGSGYTGSTGENIFLQTAGNRSMLGNDFTQINDLGYGLVTTNGALSEMVSMFTYYCHAAYYAKNGSEIRSTNGSNGYGFFGLVAEGADPNEIPDQVTLKDPMIQPCKAFSIIGDYPNAFDDTTIYVTDMAVPPTVNSQITIDHGGITGSLNYIISQVQNISDTDNDGNIGESASDVAVGSVKTIDNASISGADGTRTAGTYIMPVTGGGVNATFTVVIDGAGAATSVTPLAPGYGYAPGDTLTTAGGSVAGWTGSNLTFDVDTVWNDGLVPQITQSYVVYKLDIRADEASANDFYGSLQDTVGNGTIIEFRHNFTQSFEGVRDPARLETRPSTAINFDESDLVTYRSLSFSNADSLSQPLAADEILAGMEAGYDFIQLEVDIANLSGGYGSTAGDTKLAILEITNTDNVTRLLRDNAGLQPGDAGYAGGMIFHWDGKMHRVTNYDDSGAFVYITFADVAGTNVKPSPQPSGLNSAVPASSRVIRAGLTTGATAEITIAISLCRATGHDFTQIGTGGFNDSNYPNVLLGDPENALADAYTDAPTATSAQVWERRKGRVFWMSTDQYGFFRVGKFFTVDQATGSIEFAGDIGLTGANSLGFKKGVTIDEFSADDGFTDESGSAVPTEKATGNYINRVLGYNVKSESPIDPPGAGGNRIGPGFLALNGETAMEGDIDMGSQPDGSRNNRITNLELPGSDGTAATNKNYVDGKVNDFDQLEDLRNTELNSTAANDLFVATGKKRIIVTPPSGGTWSAGNTIGLPASGSPTKTGVIVDVETATDPILGSVNIITYTPTLGVFLTTETIYDIPGGSVSSVIEDGPVDEWANASEAGTSVINWSVSRTAAGATIDFQIENDTIVNADVNSSAAISQSKLSMQNANTFDEDNAVSGWSGSATKVQADLGLAKFSDWNFETTSGYVRVKDNGLVFAELQDIGQYCVYGRQTAGTTVNATSLTAANNDTHYMIKTIGTTNFTLIGASSNTVGLVFRKSGSTGVGTGTVETVGDPENVAYSDVLKYGSGLEDRDFNSREWTYPDIVKLVFPSRVSVTDGNTLSQTQGANTITGTVQGTVYLENTVYVRSVASTPTAGISFNTSSAITNTTTSTSLGTPTTATATTTVGSALIKTDTGLYATTAVSTGTGPNTIARRTADGTLDASKYKLGGYDALTLASTTISLKTPGGATILSAAGTTSASLITDIPGSIDVGDTGITAESASQAGSSYAGEGFVAADWIYANFIECESEKGDAAANATGIGLGAGNGFTGAAANTILLIADGTPRVTVKTTSVDFTDNVNIDGNVIITSAGDFTIKDATSPTQVTKFSVDGATGNTTIAGNTTITGNLTVNGNTTIGDAATDTVTFTADVAGSILPNGVGTQNIGSNTDRWNTMYATVFNGTATQAKYADLAERYIADADYEPGTVLVFGGEAEVTATSSKGDHRVAGVVSTNPAHLMNADLKAEYVVDLALTGRVPCKVLGRVKKGDLLVTAAIPGYAVASNSPGVGTVIGKALENKDDDNKGVIEVVVGKV